MLNLVKRVYDIMKYTSNEDSTKYWSSRQEGYIAKITGGYVQPASGAGKFKKCDVIVDNKFLIEAKTATTEKQQFTIKKDWLTKLKSEVVMSHKVDGFLAFNFGAENGNNYFVLTEQQFIDYLNYLREGDN